LKKVLADVENEENSDDVRFLAALALWRTGFQKDVSSILIRSLGEKHEGHRILAARVISVLGPEAKTMAQALKKGLLRETPRARPYLTLALWSIEPLDGGTDMSSEARRKVAVGLRDILEKTECAWFFDWEELPLYNTWPERMDWYRNTTEDR